MNWKEELEKQLALIGWTLDDRGCEHYQFVDNNGRPAPFEFLTDRIELKRKSDDSWSITWYLKDCKFELLRNPNTLGIGPKAGGDIFIQLYQWPKGGE